MLKRIIATMLVFVTVIGLLPVLPVSMEAEAAGKTASEIKTQIKETYSAACKLKIPSQSVTPVDSFDGYCGKYVNRQLYILGITTTVPSGHGYQQYDNYCNKSKSSGGYTIGAYPRADYTLKSALNTISENGTKDVYNILVGFDHSEYGHVFFIHAIIDGTVYFSESFDIGSSLCGKGISEGSVAAASISQVSTYYCTRLGYKFEGVIHFGGKTPSSTSNITTVSITAGNYQIKNKSTGTSLTVVDSKDKNNQNIGVAKYTAASGQKFYIYSYNGSYGIRPQCSSSSQRVVNVSTPETVSSGCNVMLWDRTNHSSQLWKFEKLSTGEYVIRSTNNMSCVLTAKSGNVCVQTYTGADTQKWTLTSLDTKYTISFDANGGSGAPSAQTKTHDTALTLSSTKPTKDGYIFVEWNTAKDGSGTSYSAGGKYTANAKATLYAQWLLNSYNLDLNGKVNGTVQGNITNIGTADIYVNGTKVATSVSDFYKAYPAGTTYTIKNIKAKTGYTYTGAATITGTINGYTGIYLEFKKASYNLDLNGKVNGTVQGNITNIGTADIYVNGTKVATSVSDFYKAYPAGTTYTIKNIKAKTGYTYIGAATITGTINGYTGIYLEFKKAATTYNLDLNGRLNGTTLGHFNGMGTADVYVNGVKVATGVSDFCKAYPAGTTYVITNIKAKAGYTYVGPEKITGTVGSKYTGVYVEFKA